MYWSLLRLYTAHRINKAQLRKAVEEFHWITEEEMNEIIIEVDGHL